MKKTLAGLVGPALVGIMIGALVVIMFGPFFCNYTANAMGSLDDCGGNTRPVAVIEVS